MIRVFDRLGIGERQAARNSQFVGFLVFLSDLFPECSYLVVLLKFKNIIQNECTSEEQCSQGATSIRNLVSSILFSDRNQSLGWPGLLGCNVISIVIFCPLSRIAQLGLTTYSLGAVVFILKATFPAEMLSMDKQAFRVASAQSWKRSSVSGSRRTMSYLQYSD